MNERERRRRLLRELYGDGFSKSRFSFTRGVVASIAAAPVATATNERTNGGSSPSPSATMAATKGFIANFVFGSS
jgi:hypothetical protein